MMILQLKKGNIYSRLQEGKTESSMAATSKKTNSQISSRAFFVVGAYMKWTWEVFKYHFFIV